MSHTTDIKDQEGETWYCIHNGDFSGDVRFVRESDIDEKLGMATEEVRIPFEVLLELVGQWMMIQRISVLEQQSGTDLLKGLSIT